MGGRAGQPAPTRLAALIAPLLAPTGTLAFFGYLWARTGDWLAYVHTQKRGWDQSFDFGISNVRVLRAVMVSGQFGFYALMLAVCTIGIVVALSFLRRWRLPPPILVYVLGIVGLAVLSSNTTSVPRFLLTAFPVFIPIAQGLPEEAFPTVVATSATLMATLFWTTSLVTWLAPWNDCACQLTGASLLAGAERHGYRQTARATGRRRRPPGPAWRPGRRHSGRAWRGP
jgi:hypothetical protein